jgi:NitT/TauT family transport system substrate-binding protein
MTRSSIRTPKVSRRSLLLAAPALGLALYTGGANAQTARFRFNLGWRVDAGAAGVLLAAERGYFREEGIDIVIDAGNGSTGAITAVASGAYEAASADFSSMVQHNLTTAERRLIAAAIMYDTNANSLIVRANSTIREPRDFIGKRIAGQPANASRALFPIFAKANNIPVDSVQWQSVDPGIGIQLFVRGEMDALAFFFMSGLMSLKAAGMPLDQTRTFRYSDYGLQSYGNALVVSARLANENPRLVQGFIRATTRGWIDCIADPDAGGRAVKARDPLIDLAIETERLKMVTEGCMTTQDTRARGWGAATEARLAASIAETLQTFGLQGTIAPADVYSDRFLAPMPDRTLRGLRS